MNNGISEKDFFDRIERDDYKRVFQMYFSEVLPVFPEIYCRKKYFVENVYVCPIVDTFLDLVIVPDQGQKTIIAILGMYHLGLDISNIPHYVSDYGNKFLQNNGYYKLSNVEWLITKSFEDKLDEYDKMILGNQRIKWLNF